MYTISACKKNVAKFISYNKKLYLKVLIIFLIGLILGVFLVATEDMEEALYTSIEVDLVDIITNNHSGFSLFFSGLSRVLVPLVIIYILSLSRFTIWLGGLYFGYQATLLGASITSIIISNKVAGLLNALFVVLPINFINFFLVASGLVVFFKRFSLARLQNLPVIHSTKIFIPKILALVLGCIFSAFAYGFIYPFLLRSIIMINA